MARRLSSQHQSDDNGIGSNSAKSYPDTINAVAEIMRQQKDLSEEIKILLTDGENAGHGSKKHLRKIARESIGDQDALDEELAELARLRKELRKLGDLGEAAIEREETERRGRRRRRKSAAETALDAAHSHLEGRSLPEPVGPELGETLGSA